MKTEQAKKEATEAGIYKAEIKRMQEVIKEQSEALKEATEAVETLEVINEIQEAQIQELERMKIHAEGQTAETIKENERLKRLNGLMLTALTEGEQDANKATAEVSKYKRLYLESLTQLDEVVKEIDSLREHADSLRARTHARKINLKKAGE
jgi:hypothetical protein